MSTGNCMRFMDYSFGRGGASNYTNSQVQTALKLIKQFVSPEFGYVERDSLLRYMRRILKARKIAVVAVELESLGV